MKNFDYLKDIDVLKPLYDFCSIAEDYQTNDPNNSAVSSRRALEWLVRAIYTLKHIPTDEKSSLYELMTGEPFTSFIDDDRLMMAAHYIRKVGNKSAHSGDATKRESFFALLNLYNFVGGVLQKLKVVKELAPFNKELLPSVSGLHIVPSETIKPISTDFIKSVDPSTLVKPAKVSMDFDLSEAETRRRYIDIMLEEAGWNVLTTEGVVLPSKACIEVEVTGMPNGQNKGFVDYVLFGSNGKPLAVVEAKRTSKSPNVGKHQAKLYADCLENEYGIRPVIYYSNGFNTYIIDGLGYPPRLVWGFHRQEDLEVLIQRRDRKPITDLRINDNITDRDYQKMGIRAICEHLNSFHRRGLLVMATGTGKTRVSISLVDVLMRNDWVKNVLFLADRTALVNQASKNFNKLLPSATLSVLSENSKPDKNARIIFSTYQTMINYIDTDVKEFSVGRFDLIIVDEAHRSVFGKYTAIFDYFDSFIIGLTATPREEVEKSTYDLFGLESGEPNFAYELSEAVADGYLVDYTIISRTTNILKNGIKYDDLSEEEQEQLEPIWEYEELRQNLNLDLNKGVKLHRDIRSKEINSYIFNKDTIDKVIEDLMKNGLKIYGADHVGKSIIFAYNHKHAELIVERFNYLYPEEGNGFCALIDNTVNYAQDLINTFEVRNEDPRIAVSVDMLDTGIDVPDILNLVFFKPVYSYIKFWQMIGRGTRLSPNIFGAGEDKKTFYIFDWLGNFEFFGNFPKGKIQIQQTSVTEKLFEFRTQLALILQDVKFQSDAFCKSLHDDLKTILQDQVKELNMLHISVRKELEFVEKFKNPAKWVCINKTDVSELNKHIKPLLVKKQASEGALKFDVLMLHIQLSLVDGETNAEKSKVKITRVAQELQKKASIPQVMAKMDTIKLVADTKFWEGADLERLEYVRNELRDLVQFVLGTGGQNFTIDIEDIVENKESPEKPILQASYKQRVTEYLASHKDLPAIQKIFKLEQLDRNDILELEQIFWKELGTKEEYEKYVSKGNLLCGDSVAILIRSLIGVDRQIALKRFSEYLSGNVMTAKQEEYLKTIITYVCQNGDISTQTLVNDSPFNEYDWIGVFKEYTPKLKVYIDEIHNTLIA